MLLPVDPQKYLVYLGVMTVMAWTPGPANLFSVANGARRGDRAALVGVLGLNSATLVWFAAAALGLGALVAAFPLVFKALTIVGALYVAWLGLKSLWAAWRDGGEAAHGHIKLGRSAFSDGFLVQIANPKAVVFFTAVLPPFIDVHRPFIPQLIAFAIGVIVMDGISMTVYGLGGAALSARMAEPRFRRGFAIFVGCVLLFAAALIATRA
jgi:threonine/homoserine/homoserine lactone efflux protein